MDAHPLILLFPSLGWLSLSGPLIHHSGLAHQNEHGLIHPMWRVPKRWTSVMSFDPLSFHAFLLGLSVKHAHFDSNLPLVLNESNPFCALNWNGSYSLASPMASTLALRQKQLARSINLCYSQAAFSLTNVKGRNNNSQEKIRGHRMRLGILANLIREIRE